MPTKPSPPYFKRGGQIVSTRPLSKVQLEEDDPGFKWDIMGNRRKGRRNPKKLGNMDVVYKRAAQRRMSGRGRATGFSRMVGSKR